MKSLAVKTVLVNSPAFIGKNLRVSGSVERVRHLKDNYFVVLHDGSSTDSIQVVVPASSELASKITSGDILQIEGHLVHSPAKGQAVELISHKIEKISERNNSLYPLVNTHKMPLDNIRKYPHLQARTQYFQNMLRLRDAAEFSFHDFYRKSGFVKMTTPIITSNDCEGAGECFNVSAHREGEQNQENVSNSVSVEQNDKQHRRSHFFSIPTQLTVSGQLHLEALLNGLHNVYTFGPAFRAEHSRTIRHLSEFYMVEAELAYVDSVHDLMDNVEQCLKFSIDSLLDDNLKELTFLWSKASKDNVELNPKKWRNVLDSDFVRLSFAEAIGILNNEFVKGTSEKESRLTMKSELLREHELFLTEKFNLPVFVYNYPKQQKAFYVRENESSGSSTCASFDLLVPRVSELVGGGVRENRLEKLENKMKEDLSRNDASSMSALEWYLDLRRFGSIPHGGYGIGFERYLLWLTGSPNIRNTIPFPRHIDHCPM